MKAALPGWPNRRRSIIASACLFALLVLASPVLRTAESPSSSVVNSSSNSIELSNVRIPMRDGVRLHADVFLPNGHGPWPTILVRTPYNRQTASTRGYRYFAERGYAVVTEDVRGRYGSDGMFGSIEQEGADGDDTIKWIVNQRWSDDRVGMAGASYVGIVQWWAAIQRNKNLLSIFPMVSGDDEYMDRYYSTGGALKLGHRLIWLSENLTPRGIRPPAYGTYIKHLPLMTADELATTRKVEMWRGPLSHPSYDDFWSRLSIRQHLMDVTAAVCSMGGWFDNYGQSDLNAFSILARRKMPVETWIGPWSHTFATRYPTIDFGAIASAHVRTVQSTWFDRVFKPAPQAKPITPTLHLFIMGRNVWRDEHEWPLARTEYTPYYLDSKGSANSSLGDGELKSRFNEDHAADHFVYDPRDPVPTHGGAICCNPRLMTPGPLDQRQLETRKDVLVYTSAALTDELEVTGPVGTTLYVATSANDTDFTAKLVDVFPDGRALLVTDGIARMRYRLSLNSPHFVKRGEPYQVHIDTGVTSWVFAKGHRIRLEVSSSNFPRFDRNLNTTEPNAEATSPTTARQTVYHDRRYPSVLVLPVIPRMRTSTLGKYSHS